METRQAGSYKLSEPLKRRECGNDGETAEGGGQEGRGGARLQWWASKGGIIRTRWVTKKGTGAAIQKL